MAVPTEYKFLAQRPGSRYKQFFLKERKIRAEVLYRATVGLEPRTAEEVARDFDVPVEAVREAIDYCTRNRALLDQERQAVLDDIRARGLDQPPHVPAEFKPQP
jgi:uncharacterized protein (DUF433 family)